MLCEVLLGAEIDQRGNTNDVSLTGRQVQRRPTIQIHYVDIRLHGGQGRNGALMAAVGRQMQRRDVVRLVGVHRVALRRQMVQQRLQRPLVSSCSTVSRKSSLLIPSLLYIIQISQIISIRRALPLD